MPPSLFHAHTGAVVAAFAASCYVVQSFVKPVFYAQPFATRVWVAAAVVMGATSVLPSKERRIVRRAGAVLGPAWVLKEYFELGFAGQFCLGVVAGPFMAFAFSGTREADDLRDRFGAAWQFCDEAWHRFDFWARGGVHLLSVRVADAGHGASHSDPFSHSRDLTHLVSGALGSLLLGVTPDAAVRRAVGSFCSEARDPVVWVEWRCEGRAHRSLACVKRSRVEKTLKGDDFRVFAGDSPLVRTWNLMDARATFCEAEGVAGADAALFREADVTDRVFSLMGPNGNFCVHMSPETTVRHWFGDRVRKLVVELAELDDPVAFEPDDTAGRIVETLDGLTN